MLVKIPNSTYVRDTRTMALINTDRSGLEEYQAKAERKPRREFTRITTEEEQEILDRFGRGQIVAQICREMNRSRLSVDRIIKKNKIEAGQVEQGEIS